MSLLLPVAIGCSAFFAAISAALPAARPAGPAIGGATDASYIDASVRIDGLLLDWAFVDIEADGATELAVSVRTLRGKRELHLHRMTRKSIEPEPFRVIPILKDIIAWTVADVRSDLEGNELVLLTRQGAWSFDPRKTEYKGNIEKLCETNLLYDVPDPRALPYWEYVLDGGEGPDMLLLPQRGGFRIFGKAPGQPAVKPGQLPWRALSTFQGSSTKAVNDPQDRKRRAAAAKRESEQREARLSVTDRRCYAAVPWNRRQRKPLERLLPHPGPCPRGHRPRRTTRHARPRRRSASGAPSRRLGDPPRAVTRRAAP